MTQAQVFFASDALLDVLNQLSATSSTKEKERILRDACLDSDQQRIIQYALDPRISYGVEQLPERKDGPVQTEWQDSEFELLDRLASRKLTGNSALDEISWSFRELTDKSAELLKRVLKKDLRCGVGASVVNAVFPRLIPVFPYMRCALPEKSNMAKWDWSAGVYSQEKADGMFANVSVDDNGRVEVSSRQGTIFPAGALGSLEASLATLRNGIQLHGELVVYQDNELLPREKGNGILNSLAQDGHLEDNQYVVFLAWDMIPLVAAQAKGKYDKPYHERFLELVEVVSGHGLVRVIESRLVWDRAGALQHYKELLQLGKEGTVVKHSSAIWRDGDSKDQVKFKLNVDVDLKIVGFRPGTPGTRTEATFGAVLCRTSDELLEVGVHGFSREVEADIHARRDELVSKGAIMTVRANAVMAPTEEGGLHSLFLPRFVELRPDKVMADSLNQVIEQFAAAIA